MTADLNTPDWDTDKYPGRHVAPIGAQAGAREIAANLYELEPGAVGAPLHSHQANEELLLVLDGTPTLRGLDGTRVLFPGAVIAFPRTAAGAHSLVNLSDATVRYLMLSTTNRPDIVEYPDVGGTLLVLDGQRRAYRDRAETDQTSVIADAFRAAIGKVAGAD